MIITKFKATKVHGYLNFEARFNKVLNFIGGLNGTGKTTVLNLINNLLTPDLKALSEMDFDTLTIEIEKSSGDKVLFVVNKNKSGTKINIGKDYLEVPSNNYGFEDYRELNRLYSSLENNIVYQIIMDLPSPMYLSLDRRYIEDPRSKLRYVSSRDDFYHFSEDGVKNIRRTNRVSGGKIEDTALSEALQLIDANIVKSSAMRANLTKKLRDTLVLNAFVVEDFNYEKFEPPKKESILGFEKKKDSLKKSLKSLEMSGSDFSENFNKFFEHIINSANKMLEVLPTEKETSEDIPAEVLFSWVMCSGQFRRIEELISKIEKHQEQMDRVYAPIQKFMDLVNDFLIETGKSIALSRRNELIIIIDGKERPLKVLSSGERQIIILFAHLSLNTKLPKDGIFIVDEPELSLHMSWQQKFAGSIHEASPNMQIILATHSPAIIDGRDEFFVPIKKQKK